MRGCPEKGGGEGRGEEKLQREQEKCHNQYWSECGHRPFPLGSFMELKRPEKQDLTIRTLTEMDRKTSCVCLMTAIHLDHI